MHIEYIAKFGNKKEEKGTFFADDNIVKKSNITAITNEYILKQYNKTPDFLSISEVKSI